MAQSPILMRLLLLMTVFKSSESRMHRRPVNSANRLGFDYADEAKALGPPPVPICDVHAHIGGKHATVIYKNICDLYGVEAVSL